MRIGRLPRGPRPWPVGRTIATVALATTVQGGCAPSLTELVAHERFDEAVCAVSLFDEEARAAELVRALRDEFDVAISIDALPAEQVEPLAPRAAEGLRARGALVRVETDTRDSTSSLTPRLAVVVARGQRPLDAQPVDLTGLAWLTGEQLPGARTESWGPSGLEQAADAVQAAGAAASAVMNLVTLGIWSLTPLDVPPPTARPSGSRTLQPTDEELARAAPQATTLLSALEQSDERTSWGSSGATMNANGVRLRAGERQSFYAVWLGGSSAQGPADALYVTLTYAATSPDGPCEIVEGMRIALGRAPSLEAQLRALFGGRMRRLAELRALAGVASGAAVGDRELDVR